MANFNNIYKASELIKLVPEIAPFIEHEDWIHVAISHDPINKMTCLISFVWDTRDIVRCGLYADEEQAIDMLLNNHDNFFAPAIANDNHTWLKIRNHEDLKFIDYILDINHEVMNVPMKLKLEHTCQDMKGHGIVHFYAIGDKVICRTRKYREAFCHTDKNGAPSNIRDTYKNAYETVWYRSSIIDIFGLQQTGLLDENFRSNCPDLKYGYQGHCCTGKEIKAAICKMFNVEF